MKKIILMLCSFIALTACTVDLELVPSYKHGGFIMRVSTTEPVSKNRTIVSDNGIGGYLVSWLEGDQLGVYEVGNGIVQEKTISNPLEYSGANATFSFDLSGSPDAPFSYTFAYPASALSSEHGHYFLTIPHLQTFSTSSFDRSADLLVSEPILSEVRPNSVMASFTRIGGTSRMVIKAPSTDEVVKNIVFSTTESCLVGSYEFDPLTGVISNNMLQGSMSITLTPAEITHYSGEFEIWFRTADITLTRNFTVCVTTDKKTYSKTINLMQNGRDLKFVNGKLTRFAVDMLSVPGTDVSMYDDTSTFITNSSSNHSRTVIINNEEYSITEYDVFPKIDELRSVFRIPSIALTNNGTLLVSCENREKPEDRGKIDILLARKARNDDTYEIRRVFDFDSNNGRTMNPVFLVNKASGRIYLFVCRLKDTSKFARDHQTDEVDFVYKYSDDDGITWSGEHSLKGLWCLNQYTAVIPSSVKGITMSNGTMLLPTMVIKNAEWYSGLLINSNDIWRFSSPSPTLGDNECTVYEDNNHIIVLDCRTYETTRRRYLYDINSDSFTETAPPIIGSAVAISAEVTNDHGLFYMGYPDSPRNSRENISFYGSKDGINWNIIYRMMDGYASYGYSAIAVNEDQLFSCYETTEAIYVQNLTPVKGFIKESVKSLP